MSVEKPAVFEDIKEVNGTRSDHLNGIQNGYSSSEKHKSSHKSSSKDKHRDKDRDHKSGSSSKHGSTSSSRDKHSSSKSHSSSHKSSSKDKERSDKSKSDRERSSDKSKSGDSSRDKEKTSSSSSSKDKHSSSSSLTPSKSSSSSSKDKSSSNSSKDKSSSSRSDKDKHRDKHHSSSSSSKDKHSSSESSKDKSSRDKSSHSSSNKDKEKHSSSSKSKHSFSKSPEKREEVKVKDEYKEDEIDVLSEPVVKMTDDYEEDPLANVTAGSSDYSLAQFKEEPLDQQMDEDSEEDIPLFARKANKRKSNYSDSEEEKPLIARKMVKTEKKPKKIKKEFDDDYSEDEIKISKKKKGSKAKIKAEPKAEKGVTTPGSGKKKKNAEDEPEVWKWWEEEKKSDGSKWQFLQHKGPLFAPPYERLPKSVMFMYDKKKVPLSKDTEEVAGFYAKMLEHDYTTKAVFNDNFFGDWRRVMNDQEKALIKDLKKCDFRPMCEYFKEQSEKNKNKSKEEKLALKTKNEEIQKEYGFCKIDGHNEKIGNFRIEPPGLFRGRGEHPKMGKLKRRLTPEDVIINCSKDSVIPKAPDGHKWKEVRSDNSVTWLASWTENVQGQVKYVMLNPSSKLKGEKDWQKYETARKLAKCIDKIRATYRDDWKAKEMRVRQRAVALYFIDRLALRAGNEKDEDQADTVGCCSLRVEHIELHKEKDGKEYVVVFDFLGKDSIRYYNEVPVEKRVFKNLELFKENKKTGDDLFDRLNTQTMNEHLRELMPNLTAKVFRTFNASFTLQNQLDEFTDADASIEEKILAYNRANRAVAVLCNHQRAVPKGHQKSMDALKDKITTKQQLIDDAEIELRDAIKQAKKGSVKEKLNADKKKKALERLKDQMRKLEVQETDRDENKTIALGTSKLNYLDPRISVAWCKKNQVPIEKIYNKTQRDKFRWAIDMATVDYVF